MTSTNKPRRILVVEDDYSVGTTLKLILARGGFAAELVSSAETALAVFEVNKFALVMTDYEMPGMKGDELTSVIKARAPEQPVVILTAWSERLERNGSPVLADSILSKPFGAAELLGVINDLVHRPRRSPGDPHLSGNGAESSDGT